MADYLICLRKKRRPCCFHHMGGERAEAFSGEPIDLPVERDIERCAGNDFHKPPRLKVLSHQLHRVEAPAHAGKTCLHETVGRGQPVGGIGYILTQRFLIQLACSLSFWLKVSPGARASAAGVTPSEKWRAMKAGLAVA